MHGPSQAVSLHGTGSPLSVRNGWAEALLEGREDHARVRRSRRVFRICLKTKFWKFILFRRFASTIDEVGLGQNVVFWGDFLAQNNIPQQSLHTHNFPGLYTVGIVELPDDDLTLLQRGSAR